MWELHSHSPFPRRSEPCWPPFPVVTLLTPVAHLDLTGYPVVLCDEDPRFSQDEWP